MYVSIHRFARHCRCAWAAVVLFISGAICGEESPLPRVPDGFIIEVAAASPLVGHPMMGSFDDRGRLYLAESAGMNLDDQQLDRLRPNFIRRLEDTDGDGLFDRSTIYADKLCIPNGALWLDGDLYVAEPPGIWRFRDTDDDGVADVRQHIAGQVNSNGMSSTLHGPVLHPSGRLFWCGGQLGFSLDIASKPVSGRMAPGVLSLKPDGSEHEMFAVGGLANPVEVTFTAEGEPLGTIAIHQRVDGERRDALMHWVYGGVSNHNPASPCVLKRSGPFLPALSDVGQVAPAGLTRYRSTQFGGLYRGDIFWSQFNTHKVVRSRLTRSGGTFTAVDEDFLISDDVDFHPTDVIEDADGSLLVIDTGGWFRHGCPTSHLAKREAKGAIYRIWRKDAPAIDDPRGLRIAWQSLDPAALAELLDDERIAVQDCAMAALASQGDRACDAIERAMRYEWRITLRRNAVWTLARIATPTATDLLRGALRDAEPSVQQSAANALGFARDRQSVDALMSGLTAAPEVRREVATALGRIGDTRAIPALVNALLIKSDLFLEHSIIYALIELNAPDLTVAGLSSPEPGVRRGVLLAVSQMEGAKLTAQQLEPLLRSDDVDLQQAAFEVAARDQSHSMLVSTALRQALLSLHTADAASVRRGDMLRELLVRLAPTHSDVVRLMGEALANEETPEPTRLLLIEAMKDAAGKQVPDAWVAGLSHELARGDEATSAALIDFVRQHPVPELEPLLARLVADRHRSESVRLAALAAIGPRLNPTPAELFEFAREQLSPEVSPFVRLAAARAVASLRLSDAQLIELATQLPAADALVLPSLLSAFASQRSSEVGLALVNALEQSPAAASLSPDELSRLLANYPGSVAEAAGPLVRQLHSSLEQQQARISEMLELLTGGDISRGKQVFFGKTANCSACHRVSGQGALIGPNLSTIAEVRQPRDLLESVIYPSASIVQGYRPLVIQTVEGRALTGLVTRESPDALWLRTADLAETRVDLSAIDSLAESTVSLMPQGLETKLTRDELRDLLAYLQSLKKLTSVAAEASP